MSYCCPYIISFYGRRIICHFEIFFFSFILCRCCFVLLCFCFVLVFRIWSANLVTRRVFLSSCRQFVRVSVFAQLYVLVCVCVCVCVCVVLFASVCTECRFLLCRCLKRVCIDNRIVICRTLHWESFS